MRKALALILLTLVAVTLVAGCIKFSEECGEFCEASTGTGGGGGTGGTTTIPPSCIPNQTSGAIDDGCGIFVSPSGNDSKNGKSRDNAVATIGHAISIAKGLPIYACAGAAKPFEEAIEIDGEVTVYGGVDCGSWKYVAGTRTKWTAAAGDVPLRVGDGASVTLADVAIEAADAVKEGGSSIAVVAQAGATVELVRCDVTAGNGKDGVTPVAPLGMGMAGVNGGPGLEGCIDMTTKPGADGGQLMCAGIDVGGGPGGNGLTTPTGGAGSPGQPEDGTNGLGGSGQKETPETPCTPGGDGAAGLAGDPGMSATGKPSISATGYQGKDGLDGASIGAPGHGGGGGGGAKKCGATNAGPSAGGGGSGGCGGAVGKGGQAGGASIGMLSVGATLLLSDVTITAKNGGKGGDGGLGQPGGVGGDGGPAGMGDGSSVACAGGKGGDGGPGGRGGGGLGGASIGIAHTGEAPEIKTATIVVATKAAAGGIGDAGNADVGLVGEMEGF